MSFLDDAKEMIASSDLSDDEKKELMAEAEVINSEEDANAS
jgi:hypothetical protein